MTILAFVVLWPLWVVVMTLIGTFIGIWLGNFIADRWLP